MDVIAFAHMICFGQYEHSYKWQSGDFKDFLVLSSSGEGILCKRQGRSSI